MPLSVESKFPSPEDIERELQREEEARIKALGKIFKEKIIVDKGSFSETLAIKPDGRFQVMGNQ